MHVVLADSSIMVADTDRLGVMMKGERVGIPMILPFAHDLCWPTERTRPHLYLFIAGASC